MSIKLKIRQYLMLLLSTPLLIGITPESTLAFTIKHKIKPNNFSDYSFFYDKSHKLKGIGITRLGASDPLTPWSQKNFSPFLLVKIKVRSINLMLLLGKILVTKLSAKTVKLKQHYYPLIKLII